MFKRFLFIIGGVVLLGFSAHEFNQSHTLDSHGKTAVLTSVSNLTKIIERDKDSFRTSTRYTATLTFKTEDGRDVTIEREFSESMQRRLKGGGPVYIEYLPEDPHTTRFAGEFSGGWLMLGLGIVLVGVGVFGGRGDTDS